MTDDELGAAIDALYEGPLETFIAERDALAKTLRLAGHTAVATQIKARIKPSLSAWAVNQLWWSHREAVASLLDVGERIRTASVRGAGPVEQAAATRDRREALNALVTLAEDVLKGGGHAAAANTVRRIRTSLEAAAAYGRTPTTPPLGRLHADLSPPGFELVAALGPITPGDDTAAAVVTTAARTAPAPSPSANEPPSSRQQRDIDRAETTLATAREEAEAAAREVDTLAPRADEQRIAAEQAEQEHETAAHALREAQREAERTERIAHRTRRTADETAKALGRAREALKIKNAAVREASAALSRARDEKG